MKKNLLPVVLLISSIQFCFGQASPEQILLSKVNPHWKAISLSASEVMRVNQCPTYRDLIQLHLSLVTDHLTLATASLALNAECKQKRFAALSELTAYYQHGVFPINTKYETPTPIFVDEVGTRCAVGELVYKSGNETFVNLISRESNLSYVSQLDQDYSALGDWAQVNGFTIDELAWIQPMYGYVCNPTLDFGDIVHVRCHGGSDGGFLPDFSEISLMLGPEYLFVYDDQSVFYLDSTDWILLPNGDCLKAGMFKQNITAVNVVTNEADTIEYFVEILEPDAISTTYHVQGDIFKCQASIEIQSSGGTPPFEYFLYNEHFDTLSNTNLCPGVYWIEIKDSHQCSKYDSLNLISSGDLNTENGSQFNLFPNPSSGQIQVRTNQNFPVLYQIFSPQGIQVTSGLLLSENDQLNLTELSNGTYYVVFEDATKQRRIFRQVVKL